MHYSDRRIQKLVKIMTKMAILNGVTIVTTYGFFLLNFGISIVGGMNVVLDMIANGMCLILVLPMHDKQYQALCWCLSSCVFKKFESNLYASHATLQKTLEAALDNTSKCTANQTNQTNQPTQTNQTNENDTRNDKQLRVVYSHNLSL